MAESDIVQNTPKTEDDEGGYYDLAKLKQQYYDYLGQKLAALLPRRAMDRAGSQGAQEAQATGDHE